MARLIGLLLVLAAVVMPSVAGAERGDIGGVGVKSHQVAE
ncbi:MAG: hypothetical protein K0R39_1248 [Symbiobacteriaceae bacterium]|jgi:hypothetical protein|nr:hypothetical protein [Symbiobacteriaceae bacterium]